MALAGLEIPESIVSGLRTGLGDDLLAVVLFGSRVRGEASMLARTPEEFMGRLPDLYLDIALDGVIFHDTDGYIAERLRFLRTTIQRNGLRREKQGRDLIWRWEQPPDPDWSLEWEGIS